jgi:hypothetical protein
VSVCEYVCSVRMCSTSNQYLYAEGQRNGSEIIGEVEPEMKFPNSALCVMALSLSQEMDNRGMDLVAVLKKADRGYMVRLPTTRPHGRQAQVVA